MNYTTYSSRPLREVKVCLLGETGVGKTSIAVRFVQEVYLSPREVTVGASFFAKKIEVDGQPYLFHIWDTAGQEKFRALAPMYYRGSEAAIVVYDITRYETFKSVKEWVAELNKNCDSCQVIVIAGNKCDLEDRRDVSKDEVEEYTKHIGAKCFETSALTAMNIQQLFREIAEYLPREKNKTGSLPMCLDNRSERKEQKCCQKS